MTFESRLQELMDEKNIDRYVLAERLELSYSAVSKYLSGSNKPGMEILIKLSNLFEVSVDYLIGKSNIRNVKEMEAVKDNPELLEFWETMTQRDELLTMFKKSKGLRPQDIKEVIHYIKWIEDRESDKNDKR